MRISYHKYIIKSQENKNKNKRGYPILMVSGELSSILMNSNYNSWHKCETSSLDMQLSQAQGVSITIG